MSGIFLIGKVNAKTSRVYKNGDEHFFLAIACPGEEVMHRVEVKPQDWGAYQEGSAFKARCRYSVFNNQVTYIPV